MLASQQQIDTRRRLNPLFNDNKLKLGLFGVNVSNGWAITTVEGRHEVTWPTSLAIARTADKHGYEAMVPVARWRGFGGESNFNGTNFETYTWAAGLGQATDDICVLTTSHVPTIHPIVAAKQATTVDHITNGRFALNVVCGWFTPELEMFGVPQMEHDTRYDYAAEWIEILKLLWSREDEFDYEGKFLRVSKGFAMPKPIQKPFPALMNAGGSGKGRHFAAKYCDMAFVVLASHDLAEGKAQIDAYRKLAREEYGRELQIWGNCYVVHGDTQQEAEAELNRYVIERATRQRSICSRRSWAGPAIAGAAARSARPFQVPSQGRVGRLSARRHRRSHGRSTPETVRYRLRRYLIELGRLSRRTGALQPRGHAAPRAGRSTAASARATAVSINQYHQRSCRLN
jgi:dimethylsulfone monooxygenase